LRSSRSFEKAPPDARVGTGARPRALSQSKGRLMTSTVADDRLVEVHASLARASLDLHNQMVEQTVAAHPELAPAPARAAAQYSYPVVVAVGGLLYMVIDVTFQSDDKSRNVGSFQGHAGGLAVGGGVGGGTAWFNYPIEQLIGKDARFQANFAAVATNINLWDMSGNVIGSIVAGGIGVGVGIVGGQGSFSS
jgi:Rhodococcus equi virulence-associated protein